MKKVLIVLLVAIGFAAILDFSGLVGAPTIVLRQTDPQARLPGEEFKPVVIPPGSRIELPLNSGRGLEVRIETHAWAYAGTLEISGEGGPVYMEWTGRYRLGRDLTFCESVGEIGWRCRFGTRTARPDAESRLIYPEGGSATITGVKFEVIAARRIAAISGEVVIYLMAALIFLGPLLRLMPFRSAGLEAALIGIGGAFLLASGPVSALSVLLLIVLGYLMLRAVEQGGSARKRRLLIALSLLILAVFSAKILMAYVALPPRFDPFALAAPLGFSYAAIRIADLLIAASSGERQSLRLREYFSFMLFPATLSAGPILSLAQYRNAPIAHWSITDFAAGLARVLIGLTKKAIADAVFAPRVFTSVDAFVVNGHLNPADAATMLVFDLLFIYLDFSAYSDLAIGAARCAGWTVPENFNWPLFRPGLGAYWRNWHMTLSGWAFRRVFFPVMIRSKSTQLAIFATMLLIGLWHVPRITWALWAAHHAVGLIVEGYVVRRVKAAVDDGYLREHKRFIQIVGHAAGIALIWIWVSLGHSFTLFASPQAAIEVYLTALRVFLP